MINSQQIASLKELNFALLRSTLGFIELYQRIETTYGLNAFHQKLMLQLQNVNQSGVQELVKKIQQLIIQFQKAQSQQIIEKHTSFVFSKKKANQKIDAKRIVYEIKSYSTALKSVLMNVQNSKQKQKQQKQKQKQKREGLINIIKAGVSVEQRNHIVLISNLLNSTFLISLQQFDQIQFAYKKFIETNPLSLEKIKKQIQKKLKNNLKQSINSKNIMQCYSEIVENIEDKIKQLKPNTFPPMQQKIESFIKQAQSEEPSHINEQHRQTQTKKKRCCWCEKCPVTTFLIFAFLAQFASYVIQIFKLTQASSLVVHALNWFLLIACLVPIYLIHQQKIKNKFKKCFSCFQQSESNEGGGRGGGRGGVRDCTPNTQKKRDLTQPLTQMQQSKSQKTQYNQLDLDDTIVGKIVEKKNQAFQIEQNVKK